jgi:hypothetical protein
MPRAGYTDALAVLLEGQPAIARPIVEMLDLVRSDIKNSEADFTGEDGALAGLQLLSGGGIQLLPVGGDVIGLGDVTAGGTPAISLNNAPRQDGIAVLVLECSDAIAQKPIFQIRTRMDNASGGLAATDAFCRVYRLDEVLSEGVGGEFRWFLQSLTPTITSTSPPTPAALNEEIVFDIASVNGILPGAAPTGMLDPSDPASFGLLGQPTYIVLFWANRSAGEPATTALWRAWNTGGFQVPPIGDANSRIHGRDFITYEGVGDTYDPNGLQEREFSMPIALLAGATFAAADAIWTTNPLDLGAVPGSGTDLQIQITSTQEGDSSVTTFIREALGATWRECADGDRIGVNNTDTGNDLSAIPRVQKYEIRADLVPSTDSVISPKLLNFGVLETTTTLIDDEIEVTSFELALDPVKCAAEIPSASILMQRDGAKDYRSFAEEAVSDNAFGALIFRLWIGHPTRIARADWLFIDDFVVRNIDSSGDGVAIDLASTLLATLEDFPVQGSRSVDFNFTSTLAQAWDDFHDNLNAPDRLKGTGPSTTESTKTVDKTISAGDTEVAIDLRVEIDFLAGGVTISSQGQWDFVPLFPSVDTGVVIPIEDYEPQGFDYGTDRRTTAVSVQYPDAASPGEYLEETYSAPPVVSEPFGAFGGAERSVIGSPLNLWLPFDGFAKDLPDLFGPRLINYFSSGVAQLRIRSRTPRPQLQIGDRLTVQSDLYLFHDPYTGQPVRGLTWYSATVAGQHDILGRDLTLWIEPPFQSIPQEVGPENVGPQTISNTAITTWPGESFRPARWPEDLADETGMGGNVGKITARWEHWAGRTRCEADQAGTYRCVLPVPMTQNVKIFTGSILAHMPVGTLTAVFRRYPSDGSPPVALATHVLTNTVGRTLDTVFLGTPELADGDDTYTVEVEATLGVSGFFEIYGYGHQIREIFS